MDHVHTVLLNSTAYITCATAVLSLLGIVLTLWKSHKTGQTIAALRVEVNHRLDEFLAVTREAGLREGRAEPRVGEPGGA